MEGVALNSSMVVIELKPLSAVNCLLATKLGTLYLAYRQPEIANGTAGGLIVTSPHLTLDGLTSNATLVAILNVTIGNRSRTLGIMVRVEPSVVTMASATSGKAPLAQ